MSISAAISADSDVASAGEFMLFGVRVVVDSMRKSVSLNNLSQYEQPHDQDSNMNDMSDVTAVAAGYASADDAVPITAGKFPRKRGVPWTEEEHKLFLLGLQKVGKGDWKGIARNFVKTRTPTQVASHAQKYFLRRSNLNRRRRRSSLFDITTDEVSRTAMEEEQVHHQEIDSKPYSSNINGFHLTTTLTQIETSWENTMSHNLVRPIPVHLAPNSSTIAHLDSNLNTDMDPSALSLRLSLMSDQRELPSRHSAFQVISSLINSDNIITVS